MTLGRIEMLWGLVLCAVAAAAWWLLDSAVRGTRRTGIDKTGADEL